MTTIIGGYEFESVPKLVDEDDGIDVTVTVEQILDKVRTAGFCRVLLDDSGEAAMVSDALWEMDGDYFDVHSGVAGSLIVVDHDDHQDVRA